MAVRICCSSVNRRKPRLISRAVAADTAKKRTEVRYLPPSLVPYVPKPKTALERVYDLIDDACSFCWRFADSNGRPWIGKEDIEEKGNGIYVVRFRCPLSAAYQHIAFEKIASEVCQKLRSSLRYVFKIGEEQYTKDIKLSYEEIAWVICEGEMDSKEADEDIEDNGCESCIDLQEEIDGELTDESTAEEVDFRIDESLENFV